MDVKYTEPKRMTWIYCITVLLALRQSCTFAVMTKSAETYDVKLDLRYGVVMGYNPHIAFLAKPRPVANRTCSSQAVLRVSFPSGQTSLKLKLDFGETPLLWSLHISDSPTGDGLGGMDRTTSNNAELSIHNRQLRLYGNDLPTSVDAAMNGGRLIKIYDNFVKKGSHILLDISDERFEWSRGRRSDVIESPFLFTLSGQSPSYGVKDDHLYLGFNRIVGGTHRTGSGLCRVELSLFQPREY